MNTQLLAELKEKLEAEKAAVTKELESFAKEDPNMKDNWEAKYPSKERGNKEEEADEASEYENLLSLEQVLELKLKDINSAMEKIEKGTYGACEKCGKEIEQERLLAYPSGKFCMACNK
jgi:RNA polymerase-binding transcription factor DksA